MLTNTMGSSSIGVGGVGTEVGTGVGNQKVPGANIPDQLIARLDAAADPAAEGIAIAAEQVRQFAGIAQGVHMMAVRAEERIPEVLERAGLNSQPS